MNKKELAAVGDYAIRVGMVAGIVWLAYVLSGYFLPLIFAIFIAVVLKPVVDRLTKIKVFGKRIPNWLAIILTMLLCVLFIFALFMFTVRPFLSELGNLTVVLPGLIQNAQVIINNWFNTLEGLNLPHGIQSFVDQFLSTVGNYVLDFTQSIVQYTFSFASNVLGIIVLPFLVYYLLKDGDFFIEGFVNLLPRPWHCKTRLILKGWGVVLSAYGRGIIVIGIIGGSVVWLGTYLIGLEYPYVFALLTAMSEALPFIGPIISVIPALFLAAFKGFNTFAVVGIFYLIYHTIDGYVLSPMITGNYLRLHTLVIIVGILAGGKLAGFWGMLFAVPVVALVRILIEQIVLDDEEKIIES